MKNVFAALRVALCVLAVSASARAADLAPLFKEMKAQYRAERFNKVIEAFEKHRGVWRTEKASPYFLPIWYYHAIALQQVGRLCEAEAAYVAILKAKPPEQIAGRVSQRRISLKGRLRGQVRVACQPRGAFEVRVAQHTAAECGVTIDAVQPGLVMVSAHAGEIELASQGTQVQACALSEVTLPGWATVRWRDAPINADVFAGQTRLGRASAEHALPTGQHELRVTGPGLVPRRERVILKAGDQQVLRFGAPPDQTRIWPWVALGTSAALLGAGGYFFAEHLGDVDTYDAARSAYHSETLSLHRAGSLQRRARQAEADADSSAERAILLGSIGAVGVAGSLIWLWAGGSSQTAIMPTGNGIRGHF